MVCAGFLYFYSTGYKCMLLVGNLIISLLTSLLLLIVIIPEPLAINDPAVLTLTLSYMIFAFVITMIRELVKDLEDVEGDAACNCKTLPVISGNMLPKILAIIFSASILSAIVWIQYVFQQWKTPVPFYYLIVGVQLPLIYLIYTIYKANNSKGFHVSSQLAKLIMFTGSSSILIFYFTFQ